MCNKIAKKENLPQLQTYVRISKQLVRQTYNSKHPKRSKKAKSARRKLQTIAFRLIRELERNFNKEQAERYKEQLSIFKNIVQQKKLIKIKFTLFTSSLQNPYPRKKHISNMSLAIKLVW